VTAVKTRVAVAAMAVLGLAGCGSSHAGAAKHAPPAPPAAATAGTGPAAAASPSGAAAPSAAKRTAGTTAKQHAAAGGRASSSTKDAWPEKLSPLTPAGAAPADPIATGTTLAGSTWKLWGWTENGQICIKDQTIQPTGSGGGGAGCGYQLPLDLTEGILAGERVLDGIAMPAAARVALERVDGTMVDVPIVARPPSVPAAYWFLSVDPASRFDAIVAYDGQGRELARKKMDPAAEDYLANNSKPPAK
jgi:hypothetical protein